MDIGGGILGLLDQIIGTIIQETVGYIWGVLSNINWGRRILIRLNFREPSADSDFREIYIYALPRYLVQRTQEDPNFAHLSEDIYGLLKDDKVFQACQESYRAGDTAQLNEILFQLCDPYPSLNPTDASREVASFLQVVDQIIDSVTPLPLKRAEQVLSTKVLQMMEQRLDQSQFQQTQTAEISIDPQISSQAEIVRDFAHVPNLPREFVG